MIKCKACHKKFKPVNANHKCCNSKCSERAGKIRRRYGIDSEHVFTMYKEQKGRCAICNARGDVHELNFTGRQVLCIDHCHTSGVVRGLLCSACNKGIGFLRDDPELLREAIKYLKRARRK